MSHEFDAWEGHKEKAEHYVERIQDNKFFEKALTHAILHLAEIIKEVLDE